MSHLGYICMHLENLYSLVGWKGSLCIWCSKECHKGELCVSECTVDLAVLNEAAVSENLHISVCIRVRYLALLIYLVASISNETAALSS